MVFESVVNPVLGPLLLLPPLWAIILISFLLSLIIVVIYKLTTDQNLMKELKEELKAFQQQIKELKADPKKAMEVQKKSMETNMKYMMHSLKPTLFTFIPIILIFGWLSANFSFEPIRPSETFNIELVFKEEASGNVEIIVPESVEVKGEKEKTIEPKVVYSLSGAAGEYLVDFQVDDETFSKEVIISDTRTYSEQVEKVNSDRLDAISINYEKLIVLPGLNWGWLGTYILSSIIFSLGLRRIMKVY